MSPSKGTAWAVAGVSIGILGLAISLLGLEFTLAGGPNIGPEAFLGISIAAVGMLVALLAASGIRDGKPREPDHDEPWWARELRDDPPKPREPDHDG